MPAAPGPKLAYPPCRQVRGEEGDGGEGTEGEGAADDEPGTHFCSPRLMGKWLRDYLASRRFPADPFWCEAWLDFSVAWCPSLLFMPDMFASLVCGRVEELAPLHEACKHEDVDGMVRLLDQDPRRLDSRDGDGMHTPLMVR